MNRRMIRNPARFEDPTALHPCAHCGNRCQARFAFCFPCSQRLPRTLRESLTRYHDSSGRSTLRADWKKRAIEHSQKYLDLPDKEAQDAFVLEQAIEGAGWACVTMSEERHDEYLKLCRAGK